MGTKRFQVYKTTDNANIVLYTGATNGIKGRLYEHKQALVEAFTKKIDKTAHAPRERLRK